MRFSTRQADWARQLQARRLHEGSRQAALGLLVVLLCSAVAGTAAAPTGCTAGGSRRRLLQDNSTATPVIETVEVDVVSQVGAAPSPPTRCLWPWPHVPPASGAAAAARFAPRLLTARTCLLCRSA